MLTLTFATLKKVAMKQFLKFMLASMTGFFLSLFILFLIFLGIISGLMGSMKDKDAPIASNSILEISFDNPIVERSNKDPFKELNFGRLGRSKTPGLDEIIKSLSKAATDDKIEGILLNLAEVDAGMATVEEIRNALLDFKQSGKFIYAYSELFSQKGYYLASVADKIILYPTGYLDLRGLNVDMMFFKGTLEKLEVKPEIIRHGKFKSAVEPFLYDKMSDENRLQVRTVVDGLWENMLSGIAASRNMEVTQLQQIADGMQARNPEDALQLRLIDKIAYYDEVVNELKEKTSIAKDNKLKLVPLHKYADSYFKEDFSAKKIAVVYATGTIVSGEGSDDEAGSDKVSSALRKARLDTTIKAIVFRVNSPGGSALASDVILREAKLASEAKPFIVSMGDLAASGGYYISCAADTIVARPNTITGSIGVFGLLFNAEDMFRNKLGITFDTVKTGKFADLGSLHKPMTEGERAIIQEQIEKIYDTFLTHVSEGRGMEKSAVDSIGQGRIWNGSDALRLGLVDVLGGLEDAIKIAAGKAGLSTYRMITLPEQKEFFEKLIEDLNAEATASVISKELGSSYTYYQEASRLLKEEGIMAAMPYRLEIR